MSRTEFAKLNNVATEYVALGLGVPQYLKESKVFFCKCKAPVFRHNWEVLYEEEGKPAADRVIEVRCQNWRCCRIYCLDIGM